MHRIEVNGIRLYAYHGCLPEEARIGGNYIVDLFVESDFSESFKTDNLQDTVDYVSLNRIVKEEMEVRSKLIEHVGKRILNRIKQEDTRIQKAGVKIRKLSPPINGDVEEVAIFIED